MKRFNSFKLVIIFFFLLSKQVLSAQEITNAEADSINTSKLNIGQMLFSGTAIPDHSRNRSWYIAPVFDIFQYNTVEGAVFNPKISVTQKLKNDKLFVLKPNLRYGFGSETLYGQLSSIFLYNPSKFGRVELQGGNFVEQFDEKSTLSPFANSSSTLFLDENFLKIYESSFFKLSHSFSPVKNIQLTNQVTWEKRTPLQNLEKLTNENEAFTSNIPTNNEVGNVEFDANKVFYQETSIRWQPELTYEYVRGKFVATSKYPAVIVKYKSAYSNIFDSSIAYDKFSIGLEGNLTLGALGKGFLSVEAGDFLSADSLSLIDFNHFQGNRTTYTSFEPNSFQLLDYYTYSTSGGYFRGHYTHKFSEIGKKVRLVPVIEGNYLQTANIDYFEFGFGLESANMPWRISFYNSWLEGKHHRAEIRFGFVLSEF